MKLKELLEKYKKQHKIHLNVFAFHSIFGYKDFKMDLVSNKKLLKICKNISNTDFLENNHVFLATNYLCKTKIMFLANEKFETLNVFIQKIQNELNQVNNKDAIYFLIELYFKLLKADIDIFFNNYNFNTLEPELIQLKEKFSIQATKDIHCFNLLSSIHLILAKLYFNENKQESFQKEIYSICAKQIKIKEKNPLENYILGHYLPISNNKKDFEFEINKFSIIYQKRLNHINNLELLIIEKKQGKKEAKLCLNKDFKENILNQTNNFN